MKENVRRGKAPILELSPWTRCTRKQWYFLQARCADDTCRDGVQAVVRFQRTGHTVSARTVQLQASADTAAPAELLGWVQTPPTATHLQVGTWRNGNVSRLAEVEFRPVSKRDPGSHPLAAVPRWNVYQPPFPLRRVCLPPPLEGLQEQLSGQSVMTIRPRSLNALSRAIAGGACVLDPRLVCDLKLRWDDVQRLASRSLLIVDLETAWRLLLQDKLVQAQLVTQAASHGIMSARVTYADVPTRGFALQDIFPFATLDPSEGFSLRVLRADRAWKRFAAENGIVTLFSSETPDTHRNGDVVSASQPVGQGRLLMTDLPGLVAGRHGPLLAPRLARHALRMHLAAPLNDDLQYWCRWDDSRIVVRDIADLARRYPPLQAVRWTRAGDPVECLGLSLPASHPTYRENPLLINTGRMDNLARHDGLPPEPLMIFMKMLARDARERTPWALRHLRGLTVIWQFESAAGRRYAESYAPAAMPDSRRVHQVNLRTAWGPQPPGPTSEAISLDEGLLGDGAFEYQAHLSARLRRLIESASPQPG